MSKRSISITTSTANRSHNHLPPPAAVASGSQRVPGILSIAGLDLRPQPSRKTQKPPTSNGSRRKQRPREGIPTSSSMPAALGTQTGSAKSEFLSHPSGRLARARAHSRTLVESASASAALASPSDNNNKEDVFLSSSAIPPKANASTAATALTGSNPFVEHASLPTSTSTASPRRRHIKSKNKGKMDRNNRSKDKRKESKHMRSAMKERVAEVPSDSAPEEMAIDLEDLQPPSNHLVSTSAPTPASEPITPPAVATSTSDDPSSTFGASDPISVPLHAASAPHLPLASHSPNSSQPIFHHNRTNAGVHNSTPSTPPRASSIQPSASMGSTRPSSRSAHPTHARNHSLPSAPFPFPFSTTASAPASPSQHLMFGARYANSAFQHSPSPNALPKPKFLAEVFMEVDELL